MNSFLPDTTSVTDENLLPRMLRVAQHLSEQRCVDLISHLLFETLECLFWDLLEAFTLDLSDVEAPQPHQTGRG